MNMLKFIFCKFENVKVLLLFAGKLPLQYCLSLQFFLILIILDVYDNMTIELQIKSDTKKKIRKKQ